MSKHIPTHTEQQDISPTIGTTVDKLDTLTSEEKEALNDYLQEDHLDALPHDHTDTEIQSFGEKLFNIGTYKGIGVVANVALSLSIANAFEYGKGKELFKKLATKIAPSYAKIRGVSHERSVQFSQFFLKTAALTTGGILLLWPIKKLEDHKPEIVKWMDDKHNANRTPTNTDLAIQEAAHKRLEMDAKPSWGNIILGRALGMAAVFGTVFALAGRDEKTVDTITNKAAETLKELPSPTLNKIGKSKRFNPLFNLSITEFYQSVIAEETLYFTTRMYKNIKRKEMLERAGNDNMQTTQTHADKIQPADTQKQRWVERAPKRKSHTDEASRMDASEPLGLGA